MSWGHTLKALPDDQQIAEVRWALQTYAKCLERGLTPPEAVAYACRWNLCSTPRCPCVPEFVGAYVHITGRRGRVGRKTRFLCPGHAVKWAQKFSLEIPR